MPNGKDFKRKGFDMKNYIEISNYISYIKIY